MTRSSPLRVSVALCTYNGGQFVGAQVQSILNQASAPFEVVVCDDGSTDDTVDIVRRLFEAATVPSELRLVATDRVGGATANFERAVRACRGEIVVLCDQDDVWHPDRLSQVVSWFERSERPALVFSDATLIDASGAATGGSLHQSLRLSSRERRKINGGAAFEVLIRRNVVTGAATAFSRDLLPLALPFPSAWVHDEWLAVVASATGTVGRIPASLVDYRLHDNNQIGVSDPSATSRLNRMLEPRRDRHRRLALRTEDLVVRLDALGVDPQFLVLARRKLEFERERAAYSPRRVRRVPSVLRHWARGDYRLLSSQGDLDVARDLLQPA